MPTTRKAEVRLRNESSRNFVAVGVAHKYSNLFRHEMEWSAVAANTSAQETFTVEFNTGFLTTGRDWWYVVAVTDTDEIYQINPRQDDLGKGANVLFLDSFELIYDDIRHAMARTLKSEKMGDFKQFFLEEIDETHGITIIIRDDEVVFEGKTSSASTPFVKTTRRPRDALKSLIKEPPKAK